MEQFLLLEVIERLRKEMVELADKKGSMLDGDVIQISRQLDRLLYYYQKNNQIFYPYQQSSDLKYTAAV